jgi:hypothetical protein
VRFGAWQILAPIIHWRGDRDGHNLGLVRTLDLQERLAEFAVVGEGSFQQPFHAIACRRVGSVVEIV